MKKIIYKFLLLILLVGNFLDVYASTNTFDRSTLENNGVNKGWKITDSNRSNVMNTPAVDASEKIYDYAEILTEEEENKLKEQIDSFISKHKMDLVIVTKKLEYPSEISNYCYSESLADKKVAKVNETFAADFYDYNDFGIDFQNYSGILLFRNTAYDPCFKAMYYDMYTFGEAQLYFTQSRYDSVLDGIYDNLHEGDYINGFLNFIYRVDNFMDQGKPSEMENYHIDEFGYLQKDPAKYKVPWGFCTGISGFISLIIVGIFIKKNKMVKKATQAEEYLDRRTVKVNNRKDVFITSHTTSYTTSSSSGGSGGGGGGFSSHSGSSGGGHSSGGGRHG